MLNVDYNKLKAFAAVFETKSGVLAAQKLNVTPSAISQSLSQLEDELGFKLFQRISKKLVATPDAKNLFDVFQKSIFEIERCLDGIRSRKDELRGLLRIGAPSEFGSCQVVKAASRFFVHHEAKFEIQFGLPDELLRKVFNHELDFAFCDYGSYLKKFEKVIEYKTVFYEEAVLVSSPGFFNKYLKDERTFQVLSVLPHCDYRKDGGVIDLWYQHQFGKSPKRYDLRLVASQVGAMIEAARNGMGLVFIPKYLIQEELNKKTLIQISIKKQEYVNPIVLAQLADKIPTRLEKAFLGSFNI